MIHLHLILAGKMFGRLSYEFLYLQDMWFESDELLELIRETGWGPAFLTPYQ